MSRNAQKFTWSVAMFAGALALGFALPSSTGSVPDAQAQSPSSSQQVVNAVALVKGTRGGREVGRWSGAIDWQGQTPILFRAERENGAWTWKPQAPDTLRILASEKRPNGISVEGWAQRGTVRAREVLVIIAPQPDHASSATARSNRQRETQRRRRRVDTSSDAREADEAEVLDEYEIADEQPRGLGDRGPGPGRGLGGADANDGLGDERGRSGGYGHGSTQPSRIHNKRAALTTGRGGHTPGDGGKRHGSAGGTQGATGNLLGSGWFGLINAPDDVAPLVNAGLILTDANILGFGHKMLSRVVLGMPMSKLRKAFSRDAASIVSHDLKKARDELERLQHYRDLPRAEQQAMLKQVESAMTREYFARARKLFPDKAKEFEQLAADYATRTDEVAKHIRTLATENAAAYRKMASTANAEHARLPTAPAKPKQIGPGKSTKIVRKTPGTAAGGYSLKRASGNWLRGTHRNAAPLPRQVADVLRGSKFKSWDAMRRKIWKTIAADKTLRGPFDARDLKWMKAGNAPRVDDRQAVGKLKRYVLHHRAPIQHGGGVYDLNNIVVVTPRYHKEVLDPSHHVGSRRK